MKVCNIDRAKALAKNVIPREGVERFRADGLYQYRCCAPVIPREGVESQVVSMFCRLFRAVIPREGVESALNAPWEIQNERALQVIPREGVERNRAIPKTTNQNDLQ